VKATEALLLAVLVLGIILVGAAIVISAVRRSPQLRRDLAWALAEQARLAALADRIYKVADEARDADPLALYIAGEIEKARRERGK